MKSYADFSLTSIIQNVQDTVHPMISCPVALFTPPTTNYKTAFMRPEMLFTTSIASDPILV